MFRQARLPGWYTDAFQRRQVLSEISL